MAAGFADDPDIVVPKIHWEWTGERMNTQAYIEGIPGRDLAGLDAAGLDRRLLARRGLRGHVVEIADPAEETFPYSGRTEFTDPEILRSSLASVILRMKSLKIGDVEDFPFLEPPTPRMITDGYQLLAELGVVAAQGYPQVAARLLARYRAKARPDLAAAFIAQAARHGLRASLAGAGAVAATAAFWPGLAGEARLALALGGAMAVAVAMLGLFANIAAAMRYAARCIAQGARTAGQMGACWNSGSPFTARRHLERAYRVARL